MFRSTIFRSALPLALASCVGAADADASGLVGEYFAMEVGAGFPSVPAERKPTLVRVDKQVDFAETEGQFYGTKLEQNFYARWTGVLRVTKAGAYGFATESDDGSRLTIDGKVVVDNGGVHAMQKKEGKVELAVGDHPLVIEFTQGGGQAGVVASWMPPGSGEAPIPPAALFHAPGAESVAWDKAAWDKMPGSSATNVAGPDYGPFVTATVEAGFPVARNTAMKGLVIKLAEGGAADLCFDADLLRVSALWSGGYLVLPKGRDGLEGHPKPAGAVHIGTKPGPGWAKAGSFADPRENHQGPLPKDWAKYRGLYLNGSQVVLSYTVGQTEVLESPAYEAASGLFTRAFTLGKSAEALTLLVCEADGATGAANGATATLTKEGASTVVGVVGAPAGMQFEIAEGNRIHLRVPAGAAQSFKLALWSGPTSDSAAANAAIAALGKPTDLHALCSGGAPRWGQPIATAFNRSTGDGPYVVDHVVVPLDNPWKSYMRLTGFDFFPDGRAVVSTMDGDVWLVEHLDDRETPTWKRFATGLFQALGVKIVDGHIYVLGRDQITELQDLNHDGEADFYRCFNNDCVVTDNYHEFALDLQADPEGNLYYCKGSPWPPEVKSADQGCLMKVSKDGGKLEIYATGLRAPNGSGMGPHGELTFSDNQGHWTPACRLNLVQKSGTFWGMTPAAHRAQAPTDYDKPLFWIPMDVDNSSGGQGWTTSGKWGPFKDQMVFTSYGKCTFFIVLHEVISGQAQGGVVQLPLSFASGLMRVREHPKDGQLYVIGMRGWQTSAGQAGCLDRVRYTGKPVHLPQSLRVTKDHLTIGFTGALKGETVANLDNWSIEEWNYKWTGNYGSDDYKPSDGKKGRDRLTPASAKLSGDGKTVTLELPGLAPVMQMKIKMKLQAADGTAVETTIYNTINVVP